MKRQVLLLLVLKHPDGWLAIPGRGTWSVGVWLLHRHHKAREEDGELCSVLNWAEHVIRNGLPAGDSHNMLHFHDSA